MHGKTSQQVTTVTIGHKRPLVRLQLFASVFIILIYFSFIISVSSIRHKSYIRERITQFRLHAAIV